MASMFQIQPVPLPLALDRHGVVKVGGTRITLDTVVKAFIRGVTAEEMRKWCRKGGQHASSLNGLRCKMVKSNHGYE